MPTAQLLHADTGTGTTDAVRFPLRNPTGFIAATYGSTPTFTIQMEGSVDGVAFVPLPTIDASDAANTPTTNAIAHTYTSGSPIALILLRINAIFEWFRFNITANTNVTIDAWMMASEN